MRNQVYIHDIPGRLRVHTDVMKNDRQAAAEVQNLLAGLPGVISVETNLLTGSTIVVYDANRLTSAEIIAVLRKGACLDAATAAREEAVPQPSTTGSLLTEVVLPRVSRGVLGWTVESAVTAALGALL
jgi:copper chaperone CopZ